MLPGSWAPQGANSTWGIVASLRSGAGQLDFERIDGKLWSPMTFNLQLDLRVFFRGIRRHIRQDWLDVQPLSTN